MQLLDHDHRLLSTIKPKSIAPRAHQLAVTPCSAITFGGETGIGKPESRAATDLMPARRLPSNQATAPTDSPNAAFGQVW